MRSDPRYGSDPFVVNAVLEVDDRPAIGEIRHHQHRRPLCITRLDGDEYPVERDRLELEFVDVERDGMSEQLLAPPFDDETVLLDRDDVFGPLVHKRHVKPCMGKHAANISANRAGPDDSDSHRRPVFVISHFANSRPDRYAARLTTGRRVGRSQERCPSTFNGQPAQLFNAYGAPANREGSSAVTSYSLSPSTIMSAIHLPVTGPK